MKRFLIIVAVAIAGAGLLVMTGCSTAQIKASVEQRVAHDIAVQVAPAAVPDLLKTRDEALAQNPPDTYLADCMGDSAAFLQALAAQQTPSLFGGGAVDANGCKATEYFDTASKSCKLGVALGAYQLYLAAHAPPAPLLAVPDPLIAACAVPAARVQKDINAFLVQFGIDLAGLKGAAAIGSAQTLTAVKAAQAAAAAAH